MIDGFSKALLIKKLKGTDYTMVHNFLGAMQGPIRTHQLWAHCDDNDVEDALDALESRILGDERVSNSILSNMGDNWGELDATLDKRMWCLQFVQPQVQHIHIRIKCTQHCPCMKELITCN
jgi:hypothetical protein